jgi:putative transposase
MNQTMFITPLTEGNYFHIYNKGINGENIFKAPENYDYFLKQYQLYCSDVFETYSYSLLKNHFHLFVYVKENVWVPKNNGAGMIQLNASKQLSHFFNSYAQSINNAFQRTGSLFQSPFKRKLVLNDDHLTSMIYYCHFNALKHRFVKGFRDWEFSSYDSILKNNSDFLAVQKVLDWFGGKEAFERMHINKASEDFDKYDIE